MSSERLIIVNVMRAIKHLWSNKSFLVFIPLFLLYFTSELILRVYYVYGEGNSKEQIEAMVNKLPSFMKDTFKDKERQDISRKGLNDALKEGDKDKIIKAYYDYAGQLSVGDQNTLYKEMLAKYPDDIKCNRAFILILTEDDKTYNFDTFVSYSSKFKPHERSKMLSWVWSKVKNFSTEKKRQYLELALKEKFETAEFYTVYNDLQSLAFKLKLPIAVDQQIDALKVKCIEKYKKMNQRNKKKGK